jgi:hypothetical protein
MEMEKPVYNFSTTVQFCGGKLFGQISADGSLTLHDNLEEKMDDFEHNGYVEGVKDMITALHEGGYDITSDRFVNIVDELLGYDDYEKRKLLDTFAYWLELKYDMKITPKDINKFIKEFTTF